MPCWMWSIDAQFDYVFAIEEVMKQFKLCLNHILVFLQFGVKWCQLNYEYIDYWTVTLRGEHRPPPIWQFAGLVTAKPTRWSLGSKCFPIFSENWHVSFGQVLYFCFLGSICCLGGVISWMCSKAGKEPVPMGKAWFFRPILVSLSCLARYLSVLIFVLC